MTTEERLANIEQAVLRILEYEGQVVAVLGAMAEWRREHAEWQREHTEEHAKWQREHAEWQKEHAEEHAELQREAVQFRRLWTHLARKHGWLDDADWPPPEQE